MIASSTTSRFGAFFLSKIAVLKSLLVPFESEDSAWLDITSMIEVLKKQEDILGGRGGLVSSTWVGSESEKSRKGEGQLGYL